MWDIIALSLVLLISFLTTRWLSIKNAQRRGRFQTRGIYLQMIAQLEQLVVELNHYGHLMETLDIRVPALLDHYESALLRTETLLRSIQKTPSFHREPFILNQFRPLVQSSVERIETFKKAFRLHTNKIPKNLSWIDSWLRDRQIPTRGCFFCSRPYLPRSFAEVRIRQQEQSNKVWACHVCRAELKIKGEVKVLHFKREGHSVHWSECPEYDPVRQFGTLGEIPHFRPKPSLSLVKLDYFDTIEE